MKHRLLSVIILSLVCVVALLTIRGGAAQARGLYQPEQPTVCSPAILVTNAADSGAGSLRDAIANVCPGGTITFSGDYTITLTSQLTINQNLTIDGGSNHVTVSGNQATRAFNLAAGQVTLTHLSIVNGNAQSINCGALGTVPCGGGIFVQNGATVTVTYSTLSNNSANYGAGVYSLGNVVVQGSTFFGNSGLSLGGGISNLGTLTVQNSTFYSNSATGGGGLYNYGVMTVQNSTLSGNTATVGGGIANVTTLSLTQTIIANSISGGDCRNTGSISISDHNLIEATGSNACGLTNGNGGSLLGVDPLVSLLGNYGGSTATFALLPGSPAIDAGGTTCPGADQRGVVRPQGTACDIGAFESRGFLLAKASGDRQTTQPNMAFSAPLVVTVTNSYSEPVNGGTVTFVGPLAGAGINPISTTTSINNGVASQNIIANNIAGSYSVTADTSRATSVSFSLVNACPITVTNNADSGTGSLRQAIADACPNGRITFGGDYTITLASELAINKDLTIDGESHHITISGNHATRVFNVTAGNITFAYLTIANGNPNDNNCGGYGVRESCGGGIFVKDDSGAVVTVTHSILSSNSASAGGGIYGRAVVVIVQDSTFSGNSASQSGGGVSNIGWLTVQNSTFSNNAASYRGGGIYNGEALTIRNSTLSGNTAYQGGGLANYYGTLNLSQTIVANSTSGGDCYSEGSTISINEYNLIESTGSNACSLTNGIGGSLIGVDPILSPLGNYGGSTQTFALLPSSPAINTGGAACPAADQRGKVRVGACDIGSYESQGFAFAKTGGDKQQAPVNAPFAQPLSVTLSEMGGSGLPGAVVTFTAPTNGASIVSPTTVIATTQFGGGAAISVRANNTTGIYSVTASTIGMTNVNFTLTNCLDPAIVTNANDMGAGSLRQAIAEVCAGGNITFGGDYTITLASELPINRSLSIDGGSHQVTVSGNHATRVFSVTVGPVTFAHLTIADGKAQTSDCGSFEACGGGIVVRNSGLVVTVTGSILSGNWAAAYGGGIFNFGTLTVLSSTLFNNSASYGGGGLYNTSGATVQSSTFWGNSANIGGGVANQQGMTIQNSTFYSNSANYSGGISHANGVLTLKNSTISGNSASNTGGGLETYGNLNLTQTIIANSLSGGDCYKGSGTIAINDHNLVESTGSNACGLTNGAGGSLIGVDPLLSPLGNYGGSTATFALLPGSPAINAGGATCPATDQRGKGRVGACDIGAYESQGFTLAKSGGDNQAVVVSTTFALPLSVTLNETGGRGLPGALITFTAPISGASIVAPTLVTTMTNASGIAAIAIQANATPGSYTIAAQSNGVADVLFNLKNLIKMYLPLILKY